MAAQGTGCKTANPSQGRPFWIQESTNHPESDGANVDSSSSGSRKWATTRELKHHKTRIEKRKPGHQAACTVKAADSISPRQLNCCIMSLGVTLLEWPDDSFAGLFHVLPILVLAHLDGSFHRA